MRIGLNVTAILLNGPQCNSCPTTESQSDLPTPPSHQQKNKRKLLSKTLQRKFQKVVQNMLVGVEYWSYGSDLRSKERTAASARNFFISGRMS